MNVALEQIGIHFSTVIDIDLNCGRVQRGNTRRNLFRKAAMKECDLDAGGANIVNDTIGALYEIPFNGCNLYACVYIDVLRLRYTGWIEKPGCGPFGCKDG